MRVGWPVQRAYSRSAVKRQMNAAATGRLQPIANTGDSWQEEMSREEGPVRNCGPRVSSSVK